MDVKTYVSRLLEDLAHVTSGEERDAFDPAWLRGYVAGVATAAQYALEGERESEGYRTKCVSVSGASTQVDAPFSRP